ncbi:MAG: CapA family protein, partial [Chloroflexota bacterium]|nr:CapA family protein [Chloroflexota bacterium]
MSQRARTLAESRGRRRRAARIRRIRVTAAALIGFAVLVTVLARGAQRDGPVETGRSSSVAAQKEVRFTVAASGDLLIHAPIYQRAQALSGGGDYDFRPMLEPIKRYIAGADLAICHVETPLVPGPPLGYPSFRTPPALADAVKATGWDVCSTASNHSLDAGQAGIATTRRALSRSGVLHTGSFASPAQRRQPLIVPVKGVKLAFLSYTEMTNGLPLPNPWSVNLARPKRILADARRARDRGAEVVVVNLHWGQEFQHTPSAAQLRIARKLTRS